MNLEFFLARRYMSSRKGSGLSVITWIALSGVVLGVAALVCVNAVMSGFDRELRTKILGNSAHILMYAFESSVATPSAKKDLFDRIHAIPGVASAMPTIVSEGFILSPHGESEGVQVKGVDIDLVRKVLDLDDYVERHAWDEFHGNAVIMGRTLAHNLGLKPGDTFNMILNRGEFSPFGMVPRMKKLKLVDTFHSGMTQFDGSFAYIPLQVAEQLFELPPNRIEIRAKDVREIDAVRERLSENLDDKMGITDWISENKHLLSALKLEKTVMSIILAFIILVASFNICGSLIMIVKEKTKDIAILKSMGSRDGSILKIFFYQGFFIGVAGTLVGVILGVILSLLLRDVIQFRLSDDVYMIDTLPVDLRLSDISIVIAGALVISAIATLYPARLAARMNPTEGLKAD